MLFLYSILENNFTFNFVFFAWKRFKESKKFAVTSTLKKTFYSKPVSAVWIKKITFLIGKGKFNYDDFTSIVDKQHSLRRKKNSKLKLIKLFIIEYCFILFLKPLFANYFIMGSCSLSEYFWRIEY